MGEDVVGIGSDNLSSSYTHSVNLVSSDLKDCQNGEDILQQAMQLAKTYNSHNLDPTSSQFRAMAIHDILKVKGIRYGHGRETVRIEMTITDVIQKPSDMQHGSF